MITVENDKITIKDELFDPKSILTCGQVFRYKELSDCWKVYSLDKEATIRKENNSWIITGDSGYFYKYFDLDNDYSKIQLELANKPLVSSALEVGKNIRILRQNPYETIISFIISANNLIPRISMILESITKLVSSLAPKLVAEIPNIVSQLLPAVIEGAVNIINAIAQALPQLLDIIVGMLPQLI